MSGYVLLRQNPDNSRIFEEVTELALRMGRSVEDGQIASWSPGHGGDLRDQFSPAARFIGHCVEDDPDLIVIVDEVSPLDLNPLEAKGWNSLVAMLILGFPDVDWIFCNVSYLPTGATPEEKSFLATAATGFENRFGIGSLKPYRGLPLFDGLGLRQWVLDLVRQKKGGGSIPCRHHVATVLDEERDYRSLVSLMAYSRGFRVVAVRSWSEAVELLGARRSICKSVGHCSVSPSIESFFLLSIEDWYLSFPDQPVGRNQPSMSDLRVRTRTLNYLGEVKHRRYLTAGHDKTEANNEEFLRAERQSVNPASRIRRAEQVAYKPAAGLFQLWKKLGMTRVLVASAKNRRGFAQGYDWPPKRSLGSNNVDGHSSPGRLLQIAELLVSRAASMRQNVNRVPESVAAAIFATQALELLGSKTPTVSLDALTLKNEFEVTSECLFAGVQHHMDIQGRMEEIRLEVRALSRWLGATHQQRQIARWNAELAILGRLVEVLRRYDQFDEERKVLTRVRVLHRKLVFSGWPTIARPLEIVPWYIESLVGSFWRFVLAIPAWILILTFAHMLVCGIDFDHAFPNALISFFALDATGAEDVWKPHMGMTPGFWVLAATTILGFVHLGIFVSHLYSLINRK